MCKEKYGSLYGSRLPLIVVAPRLMVQVRLREPEGVSYLRVATYFIDIDPSYL